MSNPEEPIYLQVFDEEVEVAVEGSDVNEVIKIPHFLMFAPIADEDKYAPLINTLYLAESGTEVHLHISSCGGVLNTAIILHNAITQAIARGVIVIAHCTGECISAASLIAFSCNVILVEEFCSFLLHDASTGIEGQYHSVALSMKHHSNLYSRFANKVYSCVMSPREIKNMLKSEDKFYMDDIEVLARLKKYAPDTIRFYKTY
jgi:ATP-dependent protease ClpP protease subunit